MSAEKNAMIVINIMGRIFVFLLGGLALCFAAASLLLPFARCLTQAEDAYLVLGFSAIVLPGAYSLGCFRGVGLLWPTYIRYPKFSPKVIWVSYFIFSIIYWIMAISFYGVQGVAFRRADSELAIVLFGQICFTLQYFTASCFFYGITFFMPRKILRFTMWDV
jgi:hypothetical protein